MGILNLTFQRATYFNNPEYFEETISLCRSALVCDSLSEHNHSVVTAILATFAGMRFRHDSLSEDLQESISFDSECVRILSSQGPAVFEGFSFWDGVRETYSKTAIEQKILNHQQLLSNSHPGTPRHRECLDHLAGWYKTKFSRTNDTAVIEESIKYHRLSLDVADSNALSRSIHLYRLCDVLLLAFEGSNKIGYLDESIALGQEILKMKGAESMRFETSRLLGIALIGRFSFFYRIEDLHELIRIMALAAVDHYALVPDRFRFSSASAHLGRCMGHPSISEAYEKTMALMQDSLSFSPTIQIQHDSLFATEDVCKRVPLDYASYLVDLGQLEKAIETLERGRALLWSEMRGLRTPIAKPIEEDLPLAKKLARY